MNSDRELDSLLQQMAAEHRPELPSPGLIWWRAQILKKQAEKERIERPATIMRLVAVGFCVALLAGLWMGQSDEIRATLGGVGAIAPLLLAAVAIGAVFIGLMWWTTSEV